MAEPANGSGISSAAQPVAQASVKSKPKPKRHEPKRSLTPRQVDAPSPTVTPIQVSGSEQPERTAQDARMTQDARSRKSKQKQPTKAKESSDPTKNATVPLGEEVKSAGSKKSTKKPRSSNGQGKSGDDASKAKKDGRWWASLKDVDPITLVPLSSLREPPFELIDTNSSIAHRFDSKALAVYFLSTGKFVDPINRQEMTRDDCLRLDAHLKRYGMAEHARCTDMLDLQNKIKLKPDSAANEAAVMSLRREAGVIAAHLFHYPSARERRPDPRGAGAVNVTDMDEQWQSSLPSMVEDDFPDMPLVRRPAREDDFPELRPPSQTAPVRAAQRPPPPSASWASVAETSRTRTLNVELPTQPQVSAASSSAAAAQPSWRDKSERPKWDFVWLGEATRPEAAPFTGRTQAIFGGAAPVDNSRFLSAGFSSTRTTPVSAALSSSAPPTDLLCPYLPRMLKAVRGFGATWMGAQEKRLKEVVDAGTSRKVVQFEPMPDARRKLVQEIAIKFWGLQAVERDPEPHRFLEVSALPGCFTPELTLQRATLVFSDLAMAEYFGSAPSTNGIMFVGCPSSTSNARVHDLMRSVLQARESEYDVFMLDGTRPDEKNVYVDISSGERARKLFKRLSAAQHDFRCRKIEWWPCGLDWAKFQIRNGQKVHTTEFQSVRAQRELDERRHRQEQLARTADGAWDDGAGNLDEKKLEAVRARLAQQVDWDDESGDAPKASSSENPSKEKSSDGSSDSDDDDDSDSD